MSRAIFRLQEDLGELLARHSKGQRPGDFSRYEDDPVGFIRDVLRGEPWSRQVEIAEAMRDNRKVVIRSCNAAGKDWLAGRLALWWIFCRGGRVVITGASEVQALEITMREVAKAFEAAGSDALRGEVRTKSFVLGNSKPIIVKTAAEAGKLTGFHDAEGLLFIIGEGQSCDEFVYEAADACATGASNRVLVTGNPTEPHGRYRRICESEVWESIKISAFDVPNVIEGREVIPGLCTIEWVKDVERDWGRASGFYTSRVLAEFPAEHESSLIKRDWLRACAYDVDPLADLVGRRPHLDRIRFDGETVFGFGFDIAARRDRCALACFIDRTLARVDVWKPQGDVLKEADRMLRLVERVVPLTRYEVTYAEGFGKIVTPAGLPQGRIVIAIDAAGLGLGPYEWLRRKVPQFNVTPFVASGAGDEANLNQRAEGYVRLANALHAGRLRIPRHQELWQELLEIRIVEGDRLRIEDKREVRKRLNRSPDIADATMMGWSAAEPYIRERERRRMVA